MSRSTKRANRAASCVAAAVIAAALLAAGTPASAEPRELDVDLSHTAVLFAIGHGGFTKVRGQFRTIDDIEVTFDPEDVSNSKVRVAVQSASLDSNHYFRDNYTRSDTFLNVIEFPQITFESTEITKTGDETGTMTGDLTLRGVARPVTFDVTYNGTGKHFAEDYMIDGFTATTTINRSDFGMEAFLPWVEDEIELLIEIEGHHGHGQS